MNDVTLYDHSLRVPETGTEQIRKFEIGIRPIRRAPPPLSGTRGSSPPVTGGSTASRRALAAELGDPMSQSGYLTARRFLMDDPGAGRPHESGFGCHQSRLRGSLIAACDRIFNPTQRTAHARAACFIHFSAARDLARGLFGRFGVGH